MINPQAIIFDIDDTLVDTTTSYRGSIIATAAFFGVSCTLDDIAYIKNKGNANNDWIVTRNIIQNNGITVSLKNVTEKFEEFYQGTPKIPGLKLKERLLVKPELLKKLSKRYPLGIVTGRPFKDADEFLKNNNFTKLFKTVVTMDDGPLKPDAFPVKLAMKNLGVSTAWMIGDTPDDIKSAVAAGAVAIGVIGPADYPQAARLSMFNAGALEVWDSVSNVARLLN